MKVYATLQKILRKSFGPLYRRIRTKRVVMFHGGRSGSTVVGYLLNDHPWIFWAGELLARRSVMKYQQKWPSIDYEGILLRNEAHTFKKCYGFEMKYQHLRELALPAQHFVHALDKIGYKHFIILTRRNVLRREVSSRISKLVGYSQIRSDKYPELNRITIDVDKIMSTLDAYHADVAEMRNLLRGKHCLELTYEDDIERDPVVAYQKICAFMNIRPYPGQPRIRKVNPFPLKEMIVNFDEVESTLHGTKYAWMLYA